MKTLSMAIIMAIALFGCKKTEIAEEFTQVDNTSVKKVQDWFYKVSATTSTANFTTPKTIIGLPKGAPDWGKIGYNQLERTYTIPVTIASHGASGKISASQYLVVKEDEKGNISGGNYTMVVIDKTKSDANTASKVTLSLMELKEAPANFTGAVLQYSMSNEFIDAGHYEAGHLTSKADQSTGKSAAVNNIMPLPECDGQEVCIDWYWQHYENGVLMWEEYLYTTCNCISGGGGGGSGNGNNSTVVDVNHDWIIKEQTVYPENWKITATVHLGGITFPLPDNNVFTTCDFLGSARICTNGGPVTCEWPTHPLYSIFTELSHAAGIVTPKQASSTVSTQVYYPNLQPAKTDFFMKPHAWDARYDLY